MRKLINLLSILFACIQSFIVQAQESPIQWKSNTFNLNVDTTAYNKSIGKGFSTSYYPYSTNVSYTFTNVGEHVTFLDTTAFYKQYLTKPGESNQIELNSIQVFNYYTAFRKLHDTTMHVYLPFYYEGKIYREKLGCELTFGKSKLIKYDSLFIDATERVENFLRSDTISEYPSLRLTYYFTIKNTTKKPILCTKDFVAWNDSQALRNNNGYVEILPGQSYKIPVQLNMDRKYRFQSAGKIEVLADGIREEFQCEIRSKYEAKRN
ncbi:MAG: hypothetical protein RI922_1749 [Bacteroidota bacterium]|jgi:hypothetical protein